MKNIPYYIDIAFCAIVLPVMAMIFPIERWFHNFPWYVMLVSTWLYALYFINRKITVPYLFKGKRERITSIVVILSSVAVTYVLSCVSLYTPKPNIHDIGIWRAFPYIQPYQQAVWSLFVIVCAFSCAIGLLTQTNIQRARRRAVEAERDKAVIELYKAQIKPHFMFNTLNSLYGLFLTKNEKALESLEKFISMMRYIHTSSNKDMVPLSEEMDYIRQYVALQSLRLNEMTTVTLDISVEGQNIPIPPMLLVTFVENCFKHGVSPVEKSKIIISIAEKGNKIIFSTSNRVFNVRRIGEHMGIDNCKRRLNLMYPHRHRIEIFNDNHNYEVKLSIDHE
ncbi:MAG: sensor histidine kinase [Muribaculaceae bacterium]|nr:sensor histidine kinase [Muribaculaceae bacterium]